MLCTKEAPKNKLCQVQKQSRVFLSLPKLNHGMSLSSIKRQSKRLHDDCGMTSDGSISSRKQYVGRLGTTTITFNFHLTSTFLVVQCKKPPVPSSRSAVRPEINRIVLEIAGIPFPGASAGIGATGVP